MKYILFLSVNTSGRLFLISGGDTNNYTKPSTDEEYSLYKIS